MRRFFLACIIVLLAAPVTTGATDAPITRRDGFTRIWASISRPVSATREKPYVDVPKGSTGEPEITYAKSRGILADGEEFFPDEPLALTDALLMLFRTRNVDDPDALTIENLPSLLLRYPLGDFVDPTEGEQGVVVRRDVTETELEDLQRTLDTLLKEEVHEVSFYSEKFHGKGTAFGETFDMHALTAAHRTFPYNTLVKVTNVVNGKSVTVRVNDRGPFVPGRSMDLSLGSFLALSERSKGKIRATIERLGDADLVRPCEALGAQARVAKGVSLKSPVPLRMLLGTGLTFASDAPIVVRAVSYPDGNVTRLEQWLLPGEELPFRPAITGTYIFTIGTKDGRGREMRTEVIECGNR